MQPAPYNTGSVSRSRIGRKEAGPKRGWAQEHPAALLQVLNFFLILTKRLQFLSVAVVRYCPSCHGLPWPRDSSTMIWGHQSRLATTIPPRRKYQSWVPYAHTPSANTTTHPQIPTHKFRSSAIVLRLENMGLFSKRDLC